MPRGVRVLAVTLTALIAVAGCGGGNRNPAFSDLPAVPTDPSASTTPSVTPTTSATPSARPIATQSTTPTRRPVPTPSRKPPTETQLPPPPKPPAPGCTGPKYVGTPASREQVKTALEAAAARTYWPTSAPQIKVPANLVKAVAWQESGWQSNVVACDGGVGLMQVMPDTARFVNQRFGQSYNIDNYQDNAFLGANYLAWLIKYFGDVYFQGNYDLTVRDPDNPVLLDAVIAAYNVGFGNVDTSQGLVIPNRQYVNNVEALMSNCLCLSY